MVCATPPRAADGKVPGAQPPSDPVISKTQATSSVALEADAAQPLGSRQYQLLGARLFNPGSRKAQRVAVQGVLITGPGESRINVTSLQTVAPACVK